MLRRPYLCLLITTSLAATTACKNESKPQTDDAHKADDHGDKKDDKKPEKKDDAKAGEGEAKAGDKADEKAKSANQQLEEKAAEQRKKVIESNTKAIAKVKERIEASMKRWDAKLNKRATKLVNTKHRPGTRGLKKVIASPVRKPENTKRDQHRHPGQTLDFCGVAPKKTVIEYGAGAGWYTEILAPYLAKQGQLIVVGGNPDADMSTPGLSYAKRTKMFLEANPVLFGKVKRQVWDDNGALKADLKNKADVVLAFRELHGWQRNEKFKERAQSAFNSLKSGGVFCVVQHRAAKDAKVEESVKAGYLPEDWLIAELKSVGFKLDKKSEINANPKDSKNYPEGVWTLPPSLALGDKDKAKYQAIGESDRMTLRFVKP